MSRREKTNSPNPENASRFEIIQINTNRSRAVHDLALATAISMEAGLILISEPDKNAIKDTKG